MRCQTCGVELPPDARFCIECGAELPQTASTGQTTVLPRFGSLAVPCRACGADSPEGAEFCVRCGQRLATAAPAPLPAAPAPLGPVAPIPAPGRARRFRRRDASRYSGAVFLIGLGLLLLFKLPFWPLILVVIGLSSYINAALRGRVREAFLSSIWLFGLAFLFSVPRIFWPGVIILAGITVLLKLGGKRGWRP